MGRVPPRCVYSRALDGENLWLAVIDDLGKGARLALRRFGSGELVMLPTDLSLRGDGVLLSARVGLHGAGAVLVPETDQRFEVVVIDGSSASDMCPRVRHVVPDPELLHVPAGPTKTPHTRDGEWHFQVVSEPGEVVALFCRKPERSAIVESLSSTDVALVVRCSVPAVFDDRLELHLVAENDSLIGVTELVPDGDSHRAVIGPDDVELSPGTGALLFVRARGATLPLRRRHNDLRRPGSAVQLPALFRTSDGAPHPVLRFAYRLDGNLAIRRPPRQGART
jgi:hypothetical protein